MNRWRLWEPLVALGVCSGALALGGCQPKASTTVDGGSTLDGGRPVDAGSADAGSLDAGPLDAGPVDAGLADAGPVDAGPVDAGEPDAGPLDAGPPDAGSVCTQHCPSSAISHLVLIVQENHTFDTYFGRYCTADAGSAPTCTLGPACCEAGPAHDPSGASPVTLDDTENGTYNPNHSESCEVLEMDDGGMSRYVTGTTCSSPSNFAYADSASAQTYWQLAAAGALADRYFQPVAGASSANDMYFARADFAFTDDAYEPDAKGADCQGGPQMSYTETTIADLLVDAGVTFGVYAGGYAAGYAADPNCATPPSACPADTIGYPCDYDPSDIPFEYYPSLTDNPRYMKDISQFAVDLADGGLPAFSYVKAIGYLTEHPGAGDLISSGEDFVQSTVDAVQSSSYADSTLILVTWDESGGFYDHVSPPPVSAIDGQPYGPRVPLLAIGPFARANQISHVTLEHSSVVKFIEWNWLGKQTGQLGTRDTVVNNLGSLLDAAKTVTAVPE